MAVKLYSELEAGIKDGYVTDILQIKGGIPIIYIPSKELMPDKPDPKTLYIVGTELYNLTVETMRPYNESDSSVQCDGRIVYKGQEDYAILECGFVYSVNKNPTMKNGHCVATLDEANDSFTCTIPDLNSGTTYHIRAYATNEKGTYYGEEYVVTTTPNTGVHNGYDWVDLGLPSGTKWATCNVGASNPQSSGGYYAWGETETKATYTAGTYKEELIDKAVGDISGNAQYDAATANWGGSWRMPTRNEMDELKNECEWFLTAINNRRVFRIIGPNGNEIFLPMAGYYDKNNLMDSDYRGYYFTGSESIVTEIIRAVYGYFYISNRGYNELLVTNQIDRYVGMTIRPVFKIN